MSSREEARIHSNDGCLCLDSTSRYWPMPSGVERAARGVFSKASRVQPLARDGAEELRDQESPAMERRFLAFSGAHVVIRGRYWWGSASPNERCTAHGGLSFVECLVPLLCVVRR